MVAVLTAALMTAAEISSLFSALGVLICFICMVIFILRINGEDLFGSSVVHVAQPPVAQVSYQKVAIPFSLELFKATEATFLDIQLKIRSDVSYVFRSYWGVMSDNLHSLMGSPWSTFYVDMVEDPKVKAEVISDVESCDISEAFVYKTLGLGQDPPQLTLGSSPRRKYPLVVCLARKGYEDADPNEVVALISIIHIKDSECQIPTCVLHQYLKQYSGQLTRLQALYTQNPGQSESTQVMENSTDTGVNSDGVNGGTEDDDDIPLEEACVVCQTRRITRALLPCRHVCVCSRCFERLETCPMCRSRFLAYFLVAPESEDDVGEANESDEEPPPLWQRVYNTVNNFLVH